VADVVRREGRHAGGPARSRNRRAEAVGAEALKDAPLGRAIVARDERRRVVGCPTRADYSGQKRESAQWPIASALNRAAGGLFRRRRAAIIHRHGSHGGSKIAFEFLVQNESDPDPDVVSSADTEVYVINPDGTGLLRLTDNFSADGFPRWSPDSTRIAFVTLESRLFVSEADGSRQARLSNNAYGALDLFDWSPDGSMIVYSGFKRGRNVSDLWISKADGSGTTMLPVRDLKSVHSPVWSPDGARIAFEGIAKGKHPPGGLYLVKSDGGKAVMLARGNVTRARWSPDGTTVSFIRDSPQPGIYVVTATEAAFAGSPTASSKMNTCGHLTARRLRSSATATSSISVARSMPFALIPASCSHSPLAYPAASRRGRLMERKLPSLGRPLAQARSISMAVRST
jgi:dipeptidyl aminopeptidase/acylaminoacyl peptidase